MFTSYTFGPLRVILDTDTGAIVSVQDSATGCAAAFLYTRAAILHATTQARLAWESTADDFA
jgi:hypothetical protein